MNPYENLPDHIEVDSPDLSAFSVEEVAERNAANKLYSDTFAEFLVQYSGEQQEVFWMFFATAWQGGVKYANDNPKEVKDQHA